MDSLKGRVAIITGASRGIGLAISRAFLDAGAKIAVCARDRVELKMATKSLEETAGGPERIFAAPVDVAIPEDAEEFVNESVAHFGRLHILVNNAGIHGPMGFANEVSPKQWEEAVRINLLGSFHMIQPALFYMRKAGYGKIIQLSGGGATKPMPFFSAYAATKAAVVRLAETVAEELRGTGIDVNSIAPGAVNTRLLDDVLAAGPGAVGEMAYQNALLQQRSGGEPPESAARLAVFLGSQASDGITGKLISAVWDRWEDLSAHRDEVGRSDLFTLRRIAGRDRGMPWADR